MRFQVGSFKKTNFLKAPPANETEPRVPHLDTLFIGGTTLVTVLVNLNVVVVSFCILFLFLVMSRFTTVPDLAPARERLDP